MQLFCHQRNDCRSSEWLWKLLLHQLWRLWGSRQSIDWLELFWMCGDKWSVHSQRHDELTGRADPDTKCIAVPINDLRQGERIDIHHWTAFHKFFYYRLRSGGRDPLASKPTQLKVAQGGTSSTIVNIRGARQNVSLLVTGLPTGTTYSWSSGNTIVDLPTGISDKLSIRTSLSTPVGTTQITVEAIAADGSTSFAHVALKAAA